VTVRPARVIPARRRRVRRAAVAAAALIVVATASGVAVAASSDSGPTPADQQVAGHKQDLLGQLRSQQRAADAARASGGSLTKPPPPADPPVHLDRPVHAGQILTPVQAGGAPAPFPASTLTVTSQYLDLRGATYLGIYAGSVPGSPQRPAIYVHTDAPAAGSASAGTLYPVPSTAGPAVLAAVNGNTVTYRCGPATHTFNLSTGRFS